MRDKRANEHRSQFSTHFLRDGSQPDTCTRDLTLLSICIEIYANAGCIARANAQLFGKGAKFTSFVEGII